MTDTPKSEAKPRDIPEPKAGNFRVERFAENGAPVIEGDFEVVMPGHLLARVGNFIEVKVKDGVAHAVKVL
jgi:hypothetical protein